MNVERLRAIYAFIAATPQEKVNLNVYCYGPPGQQKGCALGLACLAGMFGLRFMPAKGHVPCLPEAAESGLNAAIVCFDLCNLENAGALFDTRGRSQYDFDHNYYISDKELFLYRVEKFFKDYNLVLHEESERSEKTLQVEVRHEETTL